MRGGLERWKRGKASEGVGQAVAYAFDGTCDATVQRRNEAVKRAVNYGTADAAVVPRFTVTNLGIEEDALDATGLARWVDGTDPLTGEPRGRELTSPDADLLLDGTMNMPKSFSLAVLLAPELRAEFDALQDRIRDRTLQLWQRELNARRVAGGLIRESIARLEVVELQHERSRALDPHIHRHLFHAACRPAGSPTTGALEGAACDPLKRAIYRWEIPLLFKCAKGGHRALTCRGNCHV